MKNLSFFEKNRIDGLHAIRGGQRTTIAILSDGRHGDTFYYADENQHTTRSVWSEEPNRRGDLVIAMVAPDGSTYDEDYDGNFEWE